MQLPPISGCRPRMQAQAVQPVAPATHVAPTGAHPFTTMPAPGNGVRDAQRAQQTLEHAQAAVQRFSDINAALAMGYRRNPSSGDAKVQHFLLENNPRRDASDLSLPATLMYEFDGAGGAKLVGVMVSSDADQALPDFGAGAWHRHPGDQQYHMHIWFDRTVEQGAFENNTGVI